VEKSYYPILSLLIWEFDCKDFLICYILLTNMLDCNYVFFKTSNHMMTIVDFEKGYCILDQKFADCLYYEEAE